MPFHLQNAVPLSTGGFKFHGRLGGSAGITAGPITVLRAELNCCWISIAHLEKQFVKVGLN